LNIFQKTVEKTQISLKSDKNGRYFTGRPMYVYDNVSNSSQHEMFQKKVVEEKIGILGSIMCLLEILLIMR
jgi:hypothetical protein